jgi:F-type H+-transporting ATPase subunit b
MFHERLSILRRLPLVVLFLAVVAAFTIGRSAVSPAGASQPDAILLAQNHGTSAEVQHGEEAQTGHAEEGEHGVLAEVLHWTNFVLLLGGIIFLLKKLLVPFLLERGRAIRQDMERSSQAIAESGRRLGAIEEKLKGLDQELALLRQAALQEVAAEKTRIEELAAADANKIVAAAEQEIEAAVKAARQDLKAYAAELAVNVAEKKIRESLTPNAEQQLLRNFFHDLERDHGSKGTASQESKGGLG